MLNQILVALLTGATALGIPMGDQENHNQDNNAPSVSNVQRAYYDESQVSNYGTGETKWYSYLSFPLYLATYDDGWHTRDLDIETGIFYTALENGSYSIDLTDLTESYGGWIVSPTIVSFDVYIDGTFSSTITLDQTLTTNGNALDGYYYNKISYNEETYPEPTYVWFFDHQEPKMEEGIFEVVGDTLTAFASTIGVGFTAMIQIFYNDGVTPLGILALIVVGVSLVWFAWNLISGLLRQRR